MLFRQNLLVVQGVSKRYGDRYALNNVSFDMEDNTATLLLGPNGAGKTTLVKCIMGLVRFSGRITLDGIDVRDNIKAIHSLIGYIPQQSAFFENLTVHQQSSLTAGLKDVPNSALRPSLEEAGLWDLREKRVGSLSSGMRQRLGIALALLRDPPFLIFDEPTNNIDIRSQIDFQSVLKKLHSAKKNILIATHISGFDEFADKAIILESGRIAALGRPEDLLERIGGDGRVFLRVRPENEEMVLGVIRDLRVTIVEHEGDWIGFSVPKKSKAGVVHSLVQSGCSIEDIIIEPTELESEYVKLLSGPK